MPFFFFRVIDTAASQLTKTAITVTAIFIIALGYDSWYYMLGYLGATKYIFNSPIQIVGEFPKFYTLRFRLNEVLQRQYIDLALFEKFGRSIGSCFSPCIYFYFLSRCVAFRF